VTSSANLFSRFVDKAVTYQIDLVILIPKVL
jgi:hypothetical protein